MGLDLADAAASPWSAAASSISGAVVYLDEGAAAAAAAAGGASMLFSLGAAAVCDLSEPRSTVRLLLRVASTSASRSSP